MANDVERKVVEMRFNNRQFESGISQTISSLGRLEKELSTLSKQNNAFDTLSKSANNFSLNGIQDSVEFLTKRFSTFGIVGMTAIQNITEKALSVGHTLTSAISSPIIEGGKRRALNIKDAKFQIKGLLEDEKAFAKEWPKLEDDINYGVKDTAYGFDEAAKAASQFMASGVKSGEEMKRSLRGISGVAAMTNTSYSEIARVFTRISGSGRVFAIDLNSLAARGLNAAATLGKALNKTEAEVRDMVSHGEIDFATFAKAMDDAYGEHAKEANETFAGSLANMKAAMARIGAVLADPMYDSMRDLFNTITPVINLIKTNLEPILIHVGKIFDGFIKTLNHFIRYYSNDVIKGLKTGLTPAQKIAKIITNIGKILNRLRKFIVALIKPIHQAFREFVPRPTLVGLMNLTTRLSKLSKRLKVSDDTARKLKNTFKGIFSVFSAAKFVLKTVVDFFVDIFKTTKLARGGFLDIAESIGLFLSKVSESIKRTTFLRDALELLYNVCRFVVSIFVTLEKRMVKLFSSVSKRAKSITLLQKLALVLKTLAKTISNFLHDVSDAFFGEGQTAIDKILGLTIITGTALKFEGWLEKWQKRIENTITPITSFLNAITGSISEIGKAFSKFLGTISATLTTFQQQIKAKSLMEISKALAVLAGALFILSAIDENKLYSAVTAMSTMFLDLGVFLHSFVYTLSDMMIFTRPAELMIIPRFFTSTASAILILSFALEKISKLPWEILKKGMAGLSGIMLLMLVVIKAISTKRQKQLVKGSSILIAFSVAIRILTDSLLELSKLSWDQLYVGLTGIGAMTGVLEGLLIVAETLQAKAFSLGAGLILIATAFRILANDLKNFAQLSWEDIGKGTAAIGAFITAIGLLAKITSKNSSFYSGLGKGKTGISWDKESHQLLSLSASMIVIGAALKIVASAAKDFSKLSWDGLAKAEIGIASIFIIMKSLAGYSTRVVDRISSLSKSLIAVGGSFILMAKSFSILGNIDILGMISAVLGLTIVLENIKLFSKEIDPDKLKAAAKSASLFGTAMLIMSLSIKKLSEIDGVALGAAVLSIIILSKALVELTKNLSGINDVSSNVSSILKLSAALLVIGLTLKLVGKIGWIPLAAAIGSIVVVLFVFSKVIDKLGKKTLAVEKISASLLHFSAAMLILGTSGFLFSLALVNIVDALSKSGTAIGNLAKDIQKNGPVIITTIVSIVKGILLALVDALKEVIPRIIETVQLAIESVLESIGHIATKLTPLLKQVIEELLPVFVECVPDLVDGLFTMLSAILDALIERVPELVHKAIILVKAIAGEIFNAFKELDPKTFASAIAAFGALVGIFVLMAKAKKYARDAVLSGVIIIAVFGLLTIMFLILNTIHADNVLTIAEGIAGALIAISACMRIVSSIPAAAAVNGLAGIAIFIGGLIIILSALGGLRQIPGLKWLIDEGAEMMQSIGRAIGKFIGGIVGGIGEGITSSMITMADNLSMFIEHLQPFIEGATKIKPSSMDGLKDLAGAILVLTAAEILDGVAGWITGGTNMIKFAKDLELLAPALVAFNNAITKDGKSLINEDAVKAASYSGKMLASMANSLPKSGGIFQAFTGESMSMDTFGEKIQTFGEAIVKYSGIVTDKSGKSLVNKNAVTASAHAGKLLSSLADGLPRGNGIAQWFGGQTMDLGTFSKHIKTFGKAIVEYSGYITGDDGKSLINTEAIEASANAGQLLSALADGLSDYGGVAQFFGGHKMTLGQFGRQLKSFGPSLAEFAKKVSGIDATNVTNVANAAQAMADVANSLENTGGFAQAFSGEKDLSNFGSTLVSFGEKFKDYSDKVASIENASTVETVTSAALNLVDLLNKMGDTKTGSENFKDGINALAEADIEGFITAFNSLLDPSKEAGVLESLREVGERIILAIGNGLLSGNTALTNRVYRASGFLMSQMEQGLKDTHQTYAVAFQWFTDQHDDFYTSESALFLRAGKNFGKKLVSGLERYQQNYSLTLQSFTNLSSAFSNKDLNYFVDFGTNIVSNMIHGMKLQKSHYQYLLDQFTTKNNKFLNKNYDNFIIGGKNCIKGIIEGMRAQRRDGEKPETVIGHIAGKMITSFEKKLGIASPSKVLFDDGQYAILGLVYGMMSLISRVKNAGTLLGDEAASSVNSSLDNLFGLDSPVITPVLDLTNIKNGSSDISRLLDNQSVGFQTSMFSRYSGIDVNPYTAQDATYDDSNVISEIQSLNEKLDSLSENLANMQVVLDSGAAIGALAPGLDRALGSITTHKGRGI
jgi:tape measure domain-containing protein